MRVHLVDGTYELFRQHFGMAARHRDRGPFDAAAGVVASTLALLADGATHIGVASDHTVESFRNDLWPGYKTSAGMDDEVLQQIPVMEQALSAAGFVVWPMVDHEADDALAAAADVADRDERVEQVLIVTPDKDLAQCVRGNRVVQFDRRKREIIDADGVETKYGVRPESIPDYLGLVGFSRSAEELKAEQLPEVSWDFDYGTNMHEGFMIARRLLAKQSGTKQIIMITDGEPTAHVMPNGQIFFDYPTRPETRDATLRQVMLCTKEDIVINTFMLDPNPYLSEFVEKMSQLNGGRAFFTTPENLGDYVLVDFLNNKREMLRGRRAG